LPSAAKLLTVAAVVGYADADSRSLAVERGTSVVSIYLYRLARWCFRRRRIVLSAWLAVVIAIIAIAESVPRQDHGHVHPSGTESQRVVSVLEAKQPAASGATTQVVFAVDKGAITSAENQAGGAGPRQG